MNPPTSDDDIGEERVVNRFRARLTEFPGRLFPFFDPAGEISAVRSLSQNHSVWCEFGSGSGNHLIELARKTPQGRFFGFELRFKRSVRTLEKAKVVGVENLYLLRTDARSAADIFEPNSVEGLYINFPDPWPRTRWEKHRLLSERTLDVASKLLKSGGFVSVKTDHRDSYLDFARFVEKDRRYRLEWKTEDLHSSPYSEGNIFTEFELLFQSKRLPVHALKISLVDLA